MIWGINDFDEAYPLPYTNDLVRLAVSANLAIKSEHLAIKPRVAYDAILTDYTEGLKSGGQPFVLAEQHQWLRDIATNTLRDPVRFWLKMGALPPVQGAVPHSAKEALDHLMPEPGLPIVFGDGWQAWAAWRTHGLWRWPNGMEVKSHGRPRR